MLGVLLKQAVASRLVTDEAHIAPADTKRCGVCLVGSSLALLQGTPSLPCFRLCFGRSACTSFLGTAQCYQKPSELRQGGPFAFLQHRGVVLHSALIFSFLFASQAMTYVSGSCLRRIRAAQSLVHVPGCTCLWGLRRHDRLHCPCPFPPVLTQGLSFKGISAFKASGHCM